MLVDPATGPDAGLADGEAGATGLSATTPPLIPVSVDLQARRLPEPLSLAHLHQPFSPARKSPREWCIQASTTPARDPRTAGTRKVTSVASGRSNFR
jgi:hypothetical protein